MTFLFPPAYSQDDTTRVGGDTSFHKIDLAELDMERLSQVDPTGKTWIKRILIKHWLHLRH